MQPILQGKTKVNISKQTRAMLKAQAAFRGVPLMVYLEQLAKQNEGAQV